MKRLLLIFGLLIVMNLALSDNTNSGDTNSIPDFNVPDVNIPDLNLPDFNISDFNVSDFNTSDFNIIVPDTNFGDSNFVPIMPFQCTLSHFCGEEEMIYFYCPDLNIPDFNSPDFNCIYLEQLEEVNCIQYLAEEACAEDVTSQIEEIAETETNETETLDDEPDASENENLETELTEEITDEETENELTLEEMLQNALDSLEETIDDFVDDVITSIVEAIAGVPAPKEFKLSEKDVLVEGKSAKCFGVACDRVPQNLGGSE